MLRDWFKNYFYLGALEVFLMWGGRISVRLVRGGRGLKYNRLIDWILESSELYLNNTAAICNV